MTHIHHRTRPQRPARPPRAPSTRSPAATGTRSSQTAAKADDERIIVNMGPQHPSTHGVLRLILEIDGETVTEARCGIGYLHTGIEKNLEFRTWTQGTTFVTRMDYLTPFFNETAYCLGGREAARHRGPDPGPGHRHPRAADGAQPALLAPGVPSPPAAWSSAPPRS